MPEWGGGAGRLLNYPLMRAYFSNTHIKLQIVILLPAKTLESVTFLTHGDESVITAQELEPFFILKTDQSEGVIRG